MAYLDDNPPVRRQFYCPRRDGTQPSGVIVVHDAENVTDAIGPDTGAEAVARFIQTRDTPGSYHDLADSDSIIQLVRYECEAFHDATGTNRHSYGVSGAYRHSDWLALPQAWRDGCVRNMAAAARRYADWLKVRRGIVIPAKRISVTAARNRVPGFISHAELDPGRRTDPGPYFPWDQFLAAFAGTDQEDPLHLDADDQTFIKTQIQRLGDKLMLGTGNPLFPPDRYATAVTLPRVLAAVQVIQPDVDEVQLASLILATLTPEAVAAAIPDGLVAGVADELAQRLAE